MAKKIKIAICYDFDGTLAPGNMQEHSFLPKLGIDKDCFWKEVKQFTEEQDMDEILSYMHIMLQKSRGKKITKDYFAKMGSEIKLFEGVETWFDRIDEYADKHNIKIEHFIISSGIKEILNGTKIKDKFKYIFASKFFYDEYGKPIAPAVAINYTTKTQCLFRINKGIFNFYDNKTINKNIPKSERYIDFSRMIYIGDGSTDIPCMKLVKMQGGYSIAVYNPTKKSQKKDNTELIVQNRADFLLPANFSEKSPLDSTIKLIIDKIIINNKLSKNSEIAKKYIKNKIKNSSNDSKGLIGKLMDFLESKNKLL